MTRLAQEDGRVKVLAGKLLPEGWLGKHWACQQLADAATGELLLFTDADTVHSPQALRLGVAAFMAEKADLRSGFLHQRLLSWGERLAVPSIFWCFFSFLPLALAHRVQAPVLSLTNGQRMLIRRSACEAIGGHAAVRANPVDNITLGRLIKARGFRWRIVDVGDFISCHMYFGFRAALERFTKNLFAVFDFRLVEYLFVWAWITLVTVEPPAVSILWLLGVGREAFALWPALLALG